jgi:PadR family transcriptional regulator, regulatory protein AphA
MKPTAVTWAVLGLIELAPRSGYEIKRTIDRTIRHFWAASYGQIYPELGRLEEQGWIEG